MESQFNNPKMRLRLAVAIGLIPVLPVFFLISTNLFTYGSYQGWTGPVILEVVGYIALGTILTAVIYAILAAVAWAVANMAERKGRSWPAFFIVALIFPVIGWIIAAVVSTDQSTLRSGTKKCPKCAEVVKEEAILCKHCGSEFSK